MIFAYALKLNLEVALQAGIAKTVKIPNFADHFLLILKFEELRGPQKLLSGHTRFPEPFV